MDKITIYMFAIILLLSALLIAVTLHHDTMVEQLNECNAELVNCTNLCIAVKAPQKSSYLPPDDVNWSDLIEVAE